MTPSNDSGKDQELNDRAELAKSHAETYSRQQRTCLHKLAQVHRDLGTSPEQQLLELLDVQAQALGVWSAAVDSAELRRQEMRQKVEDCLKEISRIRDTLDVDANFQVAPELLLDDVSHDCHAASHLLQPRPLHRFYQDDKTFAAASVLAGRPGVPTQGAERCGGRGAHTRTRTVVFDGDG